MLAFQSKLDFPFFLPFKTTTTFIHPYPPHYCIHPSTPSNNLGPIAVIKARHPEKTLFFVRKNKREKKKPELDSSESESFRYALIPSVRDLF